VPTRAAVAIAVVAVIFPASSRAGVTLHYEGTLREGSDVAEIVAKATAFAKARGWPSEPATGGVVLRPHPWSEPVELVFEGGALRKSWVKTQFAGPETHIAIVELFRALAPSFERLTIDDEGQYWDTSDRNRLVLRMQSDGLMMMRMQQERPGTTGPYVAGDGRIVDLVVSTDPAAGEALKAQLRAAGAKLLPAPLVPSLPWGPKVPRLAPIAAAWQSFDSKEDRFTVSFPGRPERSSDADGATYAVRAGRVVFIVRAFAPVTGAEAAKMLADMPAALAQNYVGRIVVDERGLLNGVPVTKLMALDHGAPVHHRALNVGSRAYYLTVFARDASPADEDVRRFFESFNGHE
jgi:hypothetical protein